MPSRHTQFSMAFINSIAESGTHTTTGKPCCKHMLSALPSIRARFSYILHGHRVGNPIPFWCTRNMEGRSNQRLHEFGEPDGFQRKGTLGVAFRSKTDPARIRLEKSSPTYFSSRLFAYDVVQARALRPLKPTGALAERHLPKGRKFESAMRKWQD